MKEVCLLLSTGRDAHAVDICNNDEDSFLAMTARNKSMFTKRSFGINRFFLSWEVPVSGNSIVAVKYSPMLTLEDLNSIDKILVKFASHPAFAGMVARRGPQAVKLSGAFRGIIRDLPVFGWPRETAMLPVQHLRILDVLVNDSKYCYHRVPQGNVGLIDPCSIEWILK